MFRIKKKKKEAKARKKREWENIYDDDKEQAGELSELARQLGKDDGLEVRLLARRF